MDTQIVAAIVGPLITALLAASAVGFKQWRNAREGAHLRSETLDRHRSQVEFIDTWLQAHERVAGSDALAQQHRERAVVDLDLLYQQMAQVMATPIPRPRNSARDIVRSLFLIGVRGGLAQLLRVLYWVALFFGALTTAATMTVAPETMAQSGLGIAIVTGVFLTVMLFLPALLLWFGARAACQHRRAARRTSAPWVDSTTPDWRGAQGPSGHIPHAADFSNPGGVPNWSRHTTRSEAHLPQRPLPDPASGDHPLPPAPWTRP